MNTLTISTHGETFLEITSQVKALIKNRSDCGALLLFCAHTSCALTINEAYEDSARVDMVEFLKHLAPRNLPFITHTTEGEDDSPSHMKSMLLQNSLIIPFESEDLTLGRWQGIYLAEFRDAPKTRSIQYMFLKSL